MNAAALAQRMEAALIERAKGGPTADPPVSERKVPRASLLSTGCARKVGYWLTGAPEAAMEPAGAAAMQSGTDLEAGVLSDFTNALTVPGLMFRQQVRVRTDWYTGSADLVVDGYQGETWIVDSKTANRDSFEIKKREGMSAEHRVQLSLYAHGVGADRIVVVLRNTDPRATRGKPSPGVYHVQMEAPNGPAVLHAELLARQAMKARDEQAVDTLPRAFTPNQWQCVYCSYKRTCHGDAAQDQVSR